MCLYSFLFVFSVLKIVSYFIFILLVGARSFLFRTEDKSSVNSILRKVAIELENMPFSEKRGLFRGAERFSVPFSVPFSVIFST